VDHDVRFNGSHSLLCCRPIADIDAQIVQQQL
jgi:hypothetical protein